MKVPCLIKKAIEAFNRTLQDLRDSTDIMGGMVVLLAGDFRQSLPVIQRGTPADEIRACIK
jgi:PIF1 helicase.